MKPNKLKRTLTLIGLALLVLILGYAALRPFHLRWGASAEDLARSMPGDLSGARWTRAVSIAAAPDDIWPWLLQFGQGRGGWYSYDWLENLLGFDIHTADRIVPELQNPQIGMPICMSGSVCPSKVHVIEPHQWFGWQAAGDDGRPVWTFVFGLFPENETHTRLVVRESFDPTFMPAAAVVAMEIPDTVMELKMLDMLKARAEGRGPSAAGTALEILTWLAALGIFLSAGVLYTRRAQGLPFLAVSLSAAAVLVLITFLFLPIWLRGLLSLGLLVGLVVSLRRSA